MGGYWIKALGEWTPEGPAYSCPDIDIAIEAIENVREINEDLRKALKEAIEIIECLDELVLNLRAELKEKEEGINA